MRVKVNTSQLEIDKLRKQIASLQQKILIKDDKIASQHEKIKSLSSILDQYKKHRFGSKSEAIHPGQGTLFNEPEASIEDQKTNAEIQVSGYKKKKSRKKTLSDSLPREKNVIDVSPEDKLCSCGCEMKKVGEDLSEKVEVIPRQIKIVQNIRPKYSCPKCKGKFAQSPAPKSIIPKSFSSESLLAHIITAKYVDGLPLYRQETIWTRAGIDLSRATMAHWVIKVAKELMPLANLIKEHTFAWKVVHLDETVVQVLKEKDRKPTSKSYAWVAARNDNKPSVYFEYHSSRSGKIASQLLDEYSGYVVTDGYAGYNSAMTNKYEFHCGCWDHCRREFFKAFKAVKEEPSSLAAYALHYIRILYGVERREKQSSAQRRYRARQLYSRGVLDHLYKWMIRNIDKVPKSSDTGKALHYMFNQWHKLINYLKDGNIPLSNERAENAIRPFVVGRKAWLFSDTPAGADASMCLYSIIETCKANGHEPFAYLSQILRQIPHCSSLEDYETLLPWNFPVK